MWDSLVATYKERVAFEQPYMFPDSCSVDLMHELGMCILFADVGRFSKRKGNGIYRVLVWHGAPFCKCKNYRIGNE